MVGLQMRLGFGSEVNRYQGGAVGKLWLEKGRALLIGEADVIRAAVSAASAGETQLVTYLGVDLFPRRGWMVGLAHELYQEDISAKGTAHDAFDLRGELLPAGALRAAGHRPLSVHRDGRRKRAVCVDVHAAAPLLPVRHPMRAPHFSMMLSGLVSAVALFGVASCSTTVASTPVAARL